MAVLAMLSADVLRIVDTSLLIAGGLVIVALAAFWWRGGHRHLLRGSPVRLNRLTPVWLWFCVVSQLFCWLIAGQFASWIDGTPAETQAPPISPLATASAPIEGHDLRPDSRPTIATPTSSPTPTAAEESLAPSSRSTVLAGNLAQILMIAACLLLARLTFPRGWKQFGLGRRPVSSDVLWAVAAWLVVLLICTLLFWGSMGLWRLLWPNSIPPAHPVVTMIEDPEVGLALRIIAIAGAAILAPIGEELFFRGLLQSGVKKLAFVRWGSWQHRWIAIAVAATLFGLMHTVTPHHIPALIALGVILGYAYERSGSIVLPILVHMLFNIKTLLWVSLGQQ